MDEATRMSEQRSVNEGMRATLSAQNSTLRSQGAAIRGMEELLKRALPEIDRMSKHQKDMVTLGSVDRLVGEVSRLGDSVDVLEQSRRDSAIAIDGKFDAHLGKQSLEALARQQQQAEHEAAAREAVTNEVVRLASSVASFASA